MFLERVAEHVWMPVTAAISNSRRTIDFELLSVRRGRPLAKHQQSGALLLLSIRVVS